MSAPKRPAAGTGRTTPKGTPPRGADGTTGAKDKTKATRPGGFTPPSRSQVRQSQVRALPPKRGARGNR